MSCVLKAFVCELCPYKLSFVNCAFKLYYINCAYNSFLY